MNLFKEPKNDLFSINNDSPDIIDYSSAVDNDSPDIIDYSSAVVDDSPDIIDGGTVQNFVY